MVVKLIISIVMITGCFNAMIAAEATNRLDCTAEDRLLLLVQEALATVSKGENKDARLGLKSVVMELKQVGGSLDNRRLLELEKLSAALLRSNSPELLDSFCSIFATAGGSTKRSMLGWVRMYALEGANPDQIRKVLVSFARSGGDALLLDETESISRYRRELVSALTELPITLTQIDTDTLQGAVRESIMCKRIDFLRPACLGLRELAARNSEDVSALIRVAEISELCYEPRDGEAPVYALRVAAKDARSYLAMHASKVPSDYVKDRLSFMIVNKKTGDENDIIMLIHMADRMKQSSAIPQMREAKKILPAAYSDWIDTVIRKLDKEVNVIK